jgi:ribonucleotide reductase alpha subunit
MTLQELKLAGEAPQWMKPEGLATISGGYMLPGETPRAMYRRVAKAAASYPMGKGYEDRFFEAMWNNWLCPATPVLTNMGTDRGLPISCFSVSLADSIDGIFTKVHEIAMLSKNGGGVGVYAGDVRGRGASIKGNGVSEGVIPWLKTFDATFVAVSQGTARRGQGAFYLPIDHVDIEEFLDLRKPTGDMNRRCLNTNHAVTITNAWMQSMVDGDKHKRHLWAELLKTRFETGEPYILFIDTVNDANPLAYKRNGLKVSTSNICCLSGDTMVSTAEGPQRIDSLVGKTVSIFDGKVWVDNSSFELKGRASLTRIHLDNGTHVDATASHRWFATVRQNNAFHETVTRNLAVGMWLQGSEWANNPRIVGLDSIEGIHPVYCPKVESTGKFALANGLMTGNSEITLFTDADHTFVCCLSSLNAYRWHEWKKTDLVALTTRFLDCVLEEYIQKSEGLPGFEPSRQSAIKGRALGIGVLGFHSLLQANMLPFDSFGATNYNAMIFSQIQEQSQAESRRLAAEFGEPEWCKGTGMRNTHLVALAPTVSNATISGGYSQSIEPIAANIYSQKSAKGTFIRKNTELEKLLQGYGKDTPEVWKSINEQSGSVQHLGFLTDEEKAVFLTAREINQFTIVKLAAQRQQWIDQAQSINLFFAANSDPKYINEVHLSAWRNGLKSLYYLRSEGVIRGDLASRSSEECGACQG